jgi:hypothetical protein
VTSLSPTVVDALEAERDSLNARFAQSLRGGVRIDQHAFLRHLRDAVAPLVDQVQAVLPERAASVVRPLFDVSLDLFSAALLGPEAKSRWVECVWHEVLPGTTLLLARDPRQVTGCLCNATVQIANQRGTRPQHWLDRMRQVAPECQSLQELLQAGAVAAWQAGMVQFRRASLTAVSTLRNPLAAIALGLPESTSPLELSRIVERLTGQKWLTVEAAARPQPRPTLACVASAGAFTGYGGLLSRPPLVRAEGQRLLVSDGRSQWEVLADAYGVWFRKTAEVPVNPPLSRKAAGVNVDRQGLVRWNKLSLSQPHLVSVTSQAVSDQTLAVTTATSHHVFLYSVLGAFA